MKKDYKGHRIDFRFGYYWWAGQAFDSLEQAKDAIDIFIENKDSSLDDSEEQRLFEDFWQNDNS